MSVITNPSNINWSNVRSIRAIPMDTGEGYYFKLMIGDDVFIKLNATILEINDIINLNKGEFAGLGAIFESTIGDDKFDWKIFSERCPILTNIGCMSFKEVPTDLRKLIGGLIVKHFEIEDIREVGNNLVNLDGFNYKSLPSKDDMEYLFSLEQLEEVLIRVQVPGAHSMDLRLKLTEECETRTFETLL